MVISFIEEAPMSRLVVALVPDPKNILLSHLRFVSRAGLIKPSLLVRSHISSETPFLLQSYYRLCGSKVENSLEKNRLILKTKLQQQKSPPANGEATQTGKEEGMGQFSQ